MVMQCGINNRRDLLCMYVCVYVWCVCVVCVWCAFSFSVCFWRFDLNGE